MLCGQIVFIKKYCQVMVLNICAVEVITDISEKRAHWKLEFAKINKYFVG
jgi:hypothetical protein